MSTTLSLEAVCARTSAGEAELATPSNGLSINQRKLLQWSDGQASLAELADRLAAGHTVDAGKVVLAAGVTKDLTARFKAGELLGKAAAAVGGKGGGRPDMAQGGGTDVAALPAALALAEQYVAAGS